MKRCWLIVLIVLLVTITSCVSWFSSGVGIVDPQPQTPIQAQHLKLSLHADAGGMQWWYEQSDGFGPLSGVAFADTGCGNCHTTVETCESCHANPDGTGGVTEPDACLACHGRIGKENVLELSDLHMAEKGMVCSSCHGTGDIHGDGNEYDSMLEPGAVDAACQDCHTTLTSNTEHNLHGDSFNCEVCHAESVITCYNCHFQTLLDSHEKKAAGAFKNFAILLNNDEGILRTGTYQSVYYDDIGFVAFGPFHGHSTITNGRTCADCHNNERIQELNANGEIVMTWWDAGEGKVMHTTGVIPFVPDQLKFQFLDFVGEAWEPVDPGTVEYQYEFCSPLTEDQLDAIGVDVGGGGSPEADNLPLSLHADAGGMQWWYEQPDGFGALSGVSFADTGCGNCHTTVETCESCHANPDGTGGVTEPDACLACHGRIGKENVLELSDLHMAEKGMVCSDCHGSGDIHGDGTEYDSMLELGAVDTKCQDCHATLASNMAHNTHGDSFNCEVCHTESVITCYNCHFQTLLDSHEKKAAGAFKNFAILLNDSEGILRTGTYQSVYYNDIGFVAFGPFHGHTTIIDGRVCGDCHDNDRVQELNANDEIVMTWWDAGEGKVMHTTGVIPFVPDKFKFQFLDFDGAAWQPVDPATTEYQYEFCTPLTVDQLNAIGVN